LINSIVRWANGISYDKDKGRREVHDISKGLEVYAVGDFLGGQIGGGDGLKGFFPEVNKACEFSDVFGEGACFVIYGEEGGVVIGGDEEV
jgi:hypothetical protein